MKLSAYQKLYERSAGQKGILIKRKKEDENNVKKFKLRIDKTIKAQQFLQVIAQKIQSSIKYHIEDIVQLAIDSCFPGKYKFQLEFVLKRNKTEANLNFYENNRMVNPMKASGGGLVNLACFAIRIAAWSLNRTNPIILLDEPFANLSDDLQPKAGEILKELSDKLGFQIIMVTHNRDTMMEIADKVFEVKLKKYKEWNESIILIRKGNIHD
jgi:DNA repair exonuclease SbcCD ATPase subunit